MSVIDLLKIGATGLTGMFAGAALYVNTSDIPATMKIEDIKSARVHWKEAFLRAKWYQAGMAVGASTAGGIVFLLDDKSESRVLWLVGSGMIFTVVPYTMLVMLGDIKKNLQDDVLETAGETWVRNHIVRWNKQHAVRTLIGVSAFGVFLYALSRK